MAISYGTYTITEVQEGSQIWTSSVAPTTPNYTFDVSKLVGDSETSIKSGDIIMHSYNRYTVLSVSSDGKTVLAGNLQSIRGATGAASVTYAIIVSNLAIVKDKNGNLSPSTITVTAKSQTGSNAMANYTGRIKIETTTNNSTWTSRINEDAATKTYTIPSDTVAIRCSLYLKGGTTTLLDQQTIPVVSDGIDGTNGADGKDAYTVILTNENHTFTGNTTSALASEIECNVIAYKGTTQVASTIGTITGQPTGMTTSLLNNGKTNASFKVKVTTSMTTKNGVLNIPITVDGKSFTKEFTYTLTLDGEKGDKGDRGTNGASQNLLLDAYAPSLAKVDAPSARYFSDASNTTITGQFIAEDNLPDPNATHFVRLTDSSATTKGRGLCFYSSGTPPFVNGHTYKIGCWVRKHAGSPKMNITLGSVGSWMPSQREVNNTEWEWFEVVRTFGDTDSNVSTQADTYKRLYFYFYNNNVASSSLDMCGFKMEEVQVNSGTARNFLLGTKKLTNWGTVNEASISDGIATFSSVSSNSWREIYPAKNFKYNLIRNQYTIFSIKVKAEVDKKCCINLGIGVDITETAYVRKKWMSQTVFFTGTGEWQIVCSAIPIFDYIFNTGSGTVDFDNCWVTVRIGAVNTYHNGFQAKEPQLCLGTTATSWSRAPEDVDEAIDNIEIGGRNLLKGSDVTNTSLTTPLLGGTSTQVIPSGTVITLSVQVDADDVVWASSGNRRIGVASSIVKDGGGNQYIEAWAAMTGRTGTGIDKTFDTSFHGRVKSTYTLQGELPLDKAFSLYVQSVTSGTVSVSRPKLEIGNKATDWTPAPEDVETDIGEAKKVATNYLSMDSTGIMVADMNDGEQKPSEATGRNVFIDNDSVDIRNGTSTLASFTGDNTKFYDPVYKKELATFGTSGAIIGANNEQRFVIEKDGIKSTNDKGATVFSVNSTDGTVVTEAQVASGGESSYYPSSKTVVFDTVGTGFTTNTTFYTKKLTAIIEIWNSAKPLTNVKVNSVTATSTLVNSYSGYWYSSTHSIDLSPFTFTYGTSRSATYQITASFVNDYGDSYNLTANVSINYDGNVTLTVQPLTGECVRTSGDNENIARMDLLGSKIIYDVIYQSSAYTKAPSMTFGTRGKNAIMAPFSVTIGEDLYANNDNQLSIGRYNINNDEYFPLAFVIGNGRSDLERSNAFSVDWDGNTIVEGNLEVNNLEVYGELSTTLKTLSISRVISTTYMSATDFARLHAYQKNGMLYLNFNALFGGSNYTVSDTTTIATISNWNAIDNAIISVPCQNDGTKVMTITVTTNGAIGVYSTKAIHGWYRTFICVPSRS